MLVKNVASSRKDVERDAMRFAAIILTLFATLIVTGCSGLPGADGRYATHDRGNGTIDRSARY